MYDLTVCFIYSGMISAFKYKQVTVLYLRYAYGCSGTFLYGNDSPDFCTEMPVNTFSKSRAVTHSARRNDFFERIVIASGTVKIRYLADK